MSNKIATVCLFFMCAFTAGFSMPQPLKDLIYDTAKPKAKSLDTFFQNAHPGEYVVTESGKVLTLIHIHSITPNSILFEEISTPAKNLNRKKISWPEWVAQKAPGHTSWSMTEIARETGEILRCYSFSRHAYTQISSQESLIGSLLERPLIPVSSNERRKVGSTPMDGESDHRKYWTPPLIFEGEKMKEPCFEVLQTTWPEDGSELEGQKLILYFDKDLKVPFPYWVELQTTHAAVQLQTIDSGTKLKSPFRGFPHDKMALLKKSPENK